MNPHLPQSAKLHVIVYAQSWHLTRSAAFHDLLLDPLQSYFDFELIGWDYGNPLPPPESERSYIFCQLVPPNEYLHADTIRMVWLPMWDNVRSYSQSWWNRMPKTLRVVAFSDAVYRHATRAGLTTLNLQYFKNPADFKPVNWSRGRVLSYWNRVGLIGPDFLAHICDVLKVDKLLFKSEPDPDYVNIAAYNLPATLGRTEVEILPTFATRQEYLAATSEANIFIAPRIAEGAGMTFLEALVRGSAVFTYNAPTMNEYITGGEDGYFFRRFWTAERVARRLRANFAYRGIGKHPQFQYTLRESEQNWNEIATLDIEKLGEAAGQRHKQGYARWQNEIPQYVDFLREAIIG